MRPSKPSASRAAALAPGCGQHERILRHVNDRIRELSGTYDFGEPLEFFCECLRPTCAARLKVADGHYEDVRARGARFLVAPGHEQPELETVLEEHDGYTVVEAR